MLVFTWCDCDKKSKSPFKNKRVYSETCLRSIQNSRVCGTDFSRISRSHFAVESILFNLHWRIYGTPSPQGSIFFHFTHLKKTFSKIVLTPLRGSVLSPTEASSLNIHVLKLLFNMFKYKVLHLWIDISVVLCVDRVHWCNLCKTENSQI